MDDLEIDLKNKKSTSESPSSTPNLTHEVGDDCGTTGLKTIKAPESIQEETCNSETFHDVSRPISQECDGNENELNVSQNKQCSKCYLKHAQQICPVLNPFHVSMITLKL